jgi:YD repeat-containing protein
MQQRDADGRHIESLAFNNKHPREPSERTELSYDRTGRLARVIRRATGGSHDWDTTTDLWYDAQDRIVRVRRHHESGPYAKEDLNVTYKWKGKRLARAVDVQLPRSDDPADPIHDAIAFEGTVHEARYHDGSPAPQPEDEYDNIYDARGRLVEIRSVGWAHPRSPKRYEWDADDQLVSIRDDSNLSTPVTRYVWRDHRLTAIEDLDRDGKRVRWETFRYDARGRVVERLVFVVPDKNGRLESSVYDRENQVLVNKYVEDEDVSQPRFRTAFRYDCGPATKP